MLDVKKHMKKILAISAASLVGVMTVVSSVLPYDSAYAESSEKTAVLKVAVEGDGSVSVNTGSREYTATEKKAFEKAFEQGTKVTIAASDGKEIESVSENGKKTTAYDIWDNRRLDFTTKNTDTTLNIVLKDKDDGVASKENAGSQMTLDDYLNLPESQELKDDGIHIDFTIWDKSEQTRQILNDYEQNDYEKYLDVRKEKAEETGLANFCDKEYFLKDAFYNKYDSYMLNYDNCGILDKYAVPALAKSDDTVTSKKPTKKKAKARIMALSGELTINSINTFDWKDEYDRFIYNEAYYTLSNGAIAFCGEAMNAGVKKGQTVGAPKAIKNDNLARVLYYGYNGPEDCLTARYGVSAAVAMTSEMVSKSYSGTTAGEMNGIFTISGTAQIYTDILAKPLPYGVTVYECSNTDWGTNWQGHEAKRQNVIYMTFRKPQPYGQIKISKTYDAKKDPVTETTYTESVIKDEYSGYVPKPFEEELAKAGSEASAQTADTAKVKDNKTDTSSKLPEKYYEIFKTEEGEYFVKMTDRTIRKTTVLPATEFFDVKTSTQKSTGKVKFKITAGTDIYTAAGDLNVKKGDPIKIGKNATGIWELGTDGTLSFKFMINKNGQTIINIQEVSAQDNYTVDGKIQSFVFETKEGQYENEAIFDPVSEKSSTGKFDNNIITIGTKASNAEILDGKTVLDSDLIRLKDTVSYKGLTPGKKYKMTGLLMDKETKKNILSRGNPVTAEVEFTPESADGTVDVIFEFDATSLGGHDVVAYEHLRNLDTNTIIASHEDIEDEDQTVHVNEVKIGTMATVNGSHEVDVPKDGMIALKDKVSFEGLIPNYEYTIKGVLMDKATGEPVKDNGKEVTAEKTFTPGAEKGWTVMEFKFNAKSLKGHDVVVFETVSHELGKVIEEKNDEDKDKPETEEPKQDETDKEETPSEEAKVAIVAEHKDLEDKGQTVHFNPDKPETGLKGKTNQAMPYILGACTAVILIGIAMVVRKKKQSK